MASIDWEATLTTLDASRLPCGGGERRVLRLAASIAGAWRGQRPAGFQERLEVRQHRGPSGGERVALVLADQPVVRDGQPHDALVRRDLDAHAGRAGGLHRVPGGPGRPGDGGAVAGVGPCERQTGRGIGFDNGAGDVDGRAVQPPVFPGRPGSQSETLRCAHQPALSSGSVMACQTSAGVAAIYVVYWQLI